MNMSAEIKQVAAALIAVQRELPSIGKGSFNPYAKNSYADLGAVLEVLLPIANRNGLTIAQPLGNVNGTPAVRTLLLHTSGEYLDDYYPISAAGMKTAANDAQQFGAAVSYARRYGIASLFCLSFKDDDAQSLTPAATVPAPAGLPVPGVPAAGVPGLKTQ